MAAAQLDKNWEDWTTRLTESYAQSLELLEQGKTDEAIYRYRAGFVLTVKQLFSEAADVYPLRFDGAMCWAAWTRQLYQLSLQTESAFKAGKIDEATHLLLNLRRHFYDLHVQCNSVKSNDALFAVVDAINANDAGITKISEAVDLFVAADPCRKAKADDNTYKEARDLWLAKIRPVLENNPLTDDNRAQILQATLPFYKTYGIQFE